MAYSLDGFGFRVCFRGFHYEQLILTFGSYQGDVMFVTCVFTVGIDIVELIWCFCKQKASKEKFSEKPEGPAPSWQKRSGSGWRQVQKGRKPKQLVAEEKLDHWSRNSRAWALLVLCSAWKNSQSYREALQGSTADQVAVVRTQLPEHLPITLLRSVSVLTNRSIVANERK